MVRITSPIFFTIMGATAVAALGSIMALDGIWNGTKNLTVIGVFAALVASWFETLVLIFVAGRAGRSGTK